MVGKGRCDSCDREGGAHEDARAGAVVPRRHVIGLGRRSRVVWLCDECAAPVAALWARTTPARLRRRDDLLDRLVDVDEERP